VPVPALSPGRPRRLLPRLRQAVRRMADATAHRNDEPPREKPAKRSGGEGDRRHRTEHHVQSQQDRRHQPRRRRRAVRRCGPRGAGGSTGRSEGNCVSASWALAWTGITWSRPDSWRIRVTAGVGPMSASRQPSARSSRWTRTISCRAEESRNASSDTSIRSRRGFLAASAPSTWASAGMVTSASPASRTTVRGPSSRCSSLTDTDSSVTLVMMSPRG